MLTFKQKNLHWTLLAVVAALLALAVLGPAITQPAHQHSFADPRMWANIPYALDVLSNAAFALFGVWGWVNLAALVRRVEFNTEHALAGLFFTGLIATAAASSWYHLQPDDAGLGIDRLGMVVAFASLLGLAVAGRVSRAAGVVVTSLVLLLGPLSIWFWLASGNVLPWLVIQFGGVLVILMLAFTKPAPGANALAVALAVRWGVVILVYAAAKLLELADHSVYALTNEFVSGHSLKHVVASLAAWPVIAAIRSAAPVVKGAVWSNAKNPGRIRETISDTASF